MISLSMTFSDLWPQFQGHDIFWSRISQVAAIAFCLEDKVTIAQWETIPNIWNGTMFGDLDWASKQASIFICQQKWLKNDFKNDSNPKMTDLQARRLPGCLRNWTHLSPGWDAAANRRCWSTYNSCQWVSDMVRFRWHVAGCIIVDVYVVRLLCVLFS